MANDNAPTPDRMPSEREANGSSTSEREASRPFVAKHESATFHEANQTCRKPIQKVDARNHLDGHRTKYDAHRMKRESARETDATRSHASAHDAPITPSFETTEDERRVRAQMKAHEQRRASARAYTARDYAAEQQKYNRRAESRQSEDELTSEKRRERAQKRRAQATKADAARANQERDMEHQRRMAQNQPPAPTANGRANVGPQRSQSPARSAKDDGYVALSPVMAIELAAPHTWVAAVMPTLVAMCAAATMTGKLPLIASFVCLLIVILMQSAVNTVNDYYDYVKGADSAEDNVDPTDAVLVYNNVNPRAALGLAIGEIAAAFLLGVYIIVLCGWIPLVIALVGAAFVFLYSAGKTPVSYLPLGEITSGVVMGGLIPLAVYMATAGTFSWLALLFAVPEIIGVGLIMMTNNACDIERDVAATRHTLPTLLGRQRARALYHALVIVWLIAIALITAVFFTHGLFIVPFMLLAAFAPLRALLSNPLNQAARIQAMGQICSVNVILGAFYCACILAGGFIVTTI